MTTYGQGDAVGGTGPKRGELVPCADRREARRMAHPGVSLTGVLRRPDDERFRYSPAIVVHRGPGQQAVCACQISGPGR